MLVIAIDVSNNSHNIDNDHTGKRYYHHDDDNDNNNDDDDGITYYRL